MAPNQRNLRISLSSTDQDGHAEPSSIGFRLIISRGIRFRSWFIFVVIFSFFCPGLWYWQRVLLQTLISVCTVAVGYWIISMVLTS